MLGEDVGTAGVYKDVHVDGVHEQKSKCPQQRQVQQQPTGQTQNLKDKEQSFRKHHRTRLKFKTRRTQNLKHKE